jgi:predicted porin
MKKLLLVAGLTALSAGTAMAQSSVTLYGRFNMAIERQKLGDVTNKSMNNVASRIGFKGVEDLGGGLKAGFQLEHRFDADTGAQTNDAFWGGAGVSEVNLGGGFGMVRLGHFTSEAYYATADYVSMHNHDTGSSSDAFYDYLGRDDDRISYRTPELGGFTFELGASLNDTGDPTQERTYDLAANYMVGPIALGAGFEKNGDQKQVGIRALYTAGPFAFGGYYQRSIDREREGVLVGKRNNFRLAGMYTFGASELHLNFGFAGAYSEVDGSKAKQLTLAYNYNLSKRTKVYAFYTQIKDGDAQLYTGADKFSSFALGVRHNF